METPFLAKHPKNNYAHALLIVSFYRVGVIRMKLF